MTTAVKRILTCMFLATSLSLAVTAQEHPAVIVPYNNDIEVDLGVGLWGIPIPTDYNSDGLTDLLVSCPDKPYKGLYLFTNIGTLEAPLFDKAVKLSDKGMNNIRLSEVDGQQYVLSKNTEWTDFVKAPYAKRKAINYHGEVLGATYKRSRSNMWNYVDWDNDGDRDIIVGIDTWDDYGWDNAYDKNGKWTRGPLHGYVYLLENKDGQYYRSKIPTLSVRNFIITL